MMFENFVDWTILGSYGGSIIATGLLTQLVKNSGKLKDIPTRWVSYGIAFVVLLLASFFTGSLTVSNAVLTLFNAAIVSLAANGGYDAIGEP
ncbi:MAG: hypothetical protein IKY90_01955 [Oscillospiraceae bacterium]|nr:hypothetical protein [Oscillospiraceae bacterium]